MIKQFHNISSDRNYILVSISMETRTRFYDIKAYNRNIVRITHGKIEGRVKDKLKTFKNFEKVINYIEKEIKRKEKQGYKRL